MLLTAVCLAGMSLAAATPCNAPRSSTPLHGSPSVHGELNWFEGTWAEVLAEAKAKKQLIFIDFWTPWCGYCKKLDTTTFRDAAVVKEMRDVLCYSVNAEDVENLAVVRTYRPSNYPTLVFAESDGRVREILIGYFDSERFLSEVARIKRNESTVTALRRRIEVNPDDVEARYELALKFREFGHGKRYSEQLEAIRRIDPDGTSTPSRRIALEAIRKEAGSSLNADALYELLESETDPSLLFEGWYAIWQLESYLGKVPRKRDEWPAHKQRAFAAARRLWAHAPTTNANYARIGNSIAFSFYEGRRYASADDLSWALGVAQTVVEAEPDDAYIVDTYACCLFAVGRREEAIETLYRAIQLEPTNPTWKKRLRSFKR